jgi:hypothetical protein
VKDNVQREVEDIVTNAKMILDARLSGIVEQLEEWFLLDSLKQCVMQRIAFLMT